MGLALSLDEMKALQRHFVQEKRTPTDVELQTIGQTWSEHCYHKTFKGDIDTDEGTVRSLLRTYIAAVTKKLNPPWCVSVFEDNAGIVDFEDGYAVAAKVETHNHPSAIEPFGGAATGTGGVIRDILGVWADPIACTDVLCFGPLDFPHERLPPGTKHPRYIFKGVVAGIGSYGNNMGIPTVNGAIYFDESYVGNVVVYCGCIGLLPKERYVRRTRPGDVAVLAGGRTGRDGIHGVTFASAELTEESEKVSRPAVQIPNPIEEERLKRAIIQIRDKGLGSGVTDLGGGGLSCALGEMANNSGCGVHVELEKVPLKYPDMAPWEIWVSESQERMLLTVPGKNLRSLLKIFEAEEVEATVVGRFDYDGGLRVDFQGHRIADLPLGFLFTPPRIRRRAVWRKPDLREPDFDVPRNVTKILLALLSAPNTASRETVVRTYDHEVKGNTVLKPLQGRYGGPNDAVVVKPLPGSWKGVVISCGMNPEYGKIDPYWMAASAIDEAIRNNVAVGGRRIALLDNFTFGNPEKPDRLGGLVRACRGCYDYARSFQTPFISGKDSLYNESPLGPVTPTLLITAIGVIPDVRRAVSIDVKSPGNLIYVVGITYRELGGSQYYRFKGYTYSAVPKVQANQARKTVSSVTKAIDAGCVKSCHDLSEGGLAVAAAEMAFSGGYGLDLELKRVPVAQEVERDDHILFSESNSRFLVEVDENRREDFEVILESTPCAAIGRVKRSGRLSIQGLSGESVLDVDLTRLREAWKGTLRR
ncbi:MAG: phosphoribosylformylglycinamidine synthase subunit PurL [Nitrososphaeria archaeon]|nr:phosphoribosylformylglycinamidine synthase subunit PurL [Nitrososphaeria archaeon]NIN52991.1 phosphoribosylformylglycinamidine synthase subunit PurL [Nitrososphaeria archaeon]NIQ33550.1 phosphoribosylformylglycinamidine synthase subunit PurL [Nitrososphaeria archaeon]